MSQQFNSFVRASLWVTLGVACVAVVLGFSPIGAHVVGVADAADIGATSTFVQSGGVAPDLQAPSPDGSDALRHAHVGSASSATASTF